MVWITSPQDFEDTSRGFIAPSKPGAVRNAAGEVAWDNDAYAFITGAAPTTVHPTRYCILPKSWERA